MSAVGVLSETIRGHAPILVILLPMAAAGIALVGKAFSGRRGFREAAIVLLGLSVVVLAFTVETVSRDTAAVPYALGGFDAEPAILLLLDGLAWVSSALVVLVGILVAVASLPHPRFDAAYFFFLMMTIAGMQSVVVTTDLFTMFVSFEIVAIGAYVLIAWERTPQGLLASLKYLFLSTVGILFFLFGIFVLYRDLGSLSMLTLSSLIPQEPAAASAVIPGFRLLTLPEPGVARSVPLAVAALCVGIGVRTAFIPFHTWLPEAHAWAPHPISALLSGVLIKVSFLAMVRIVAAFHAAYLMPLFLWIGAITALVAVGWALAQHDAKRLLAFHSISQMGYILAAWGAAGALSGVAAYSHAISHALFKSLLFIVVGIAIERAGTRDVYRMRGVGRGAPLLAVGVIAGSLAISGIPPFNGFISKQLISSALYGSPAYVLLQITSVGTVASFIKLSSIVLPGNGGNGREGASAGRLPPTERFSIAVLAVLTLAGGIAGRVVTRFLQNLTDGGGERGAIPALFELSAVADAGVTAALGAAVALVVMSAPGRRVAHRLSEVAPELRTVLLFFVVGLVLFSLAPWISI
ncbi:MAG: proton-conducting transporter membrane subunit [Alkalispirochaeta sp.]